MLSNSNVQNPSDGSGLTFTQNRANVGPSQRLCQIHTLERKQEVLWSPRLKEKWRGRKYVKVAFQLYSVFVSVALSASTPQLPDTVPEPAGSDQTHTCSHTSLPSGHCLNTLVRKTARSRFLSSLHRRLLCSSVWRFSHEAGDAGDRSESVRAVHGEKDRLYRQKPGPSLGLRASSRSRAQNLQNR